LPFFSFTPSTFFEDNNIFRACANAELTRIQIYTGNYDINTNITTLKDELLADGDFYTTTSIEIRIYS
jgi:hypothetical protein